MIRKAEDEDVAAVAASYRELFEYEAAHGSRTNWVAGLYPTEGTARAAFEEGALYVGRQGGVLCGSVVLNHEQPPEYRGVDWHFEAEPSKVLVVHTLCVPPSQRGMGHGRGLVEFALRHAAQTGCRAVRLDTWEQNRPAAALYERLGFRLAGTAPMLLQGAIREQQIYLEHEV